jgi:hypothetical protein
MFNAHQTRYDIFMSNENGLSVYAFAVPFDNPFLDETKFNEQFLLDLILTRLYIVQDGKYKKYIVY